MKKDTPIHHLREDYKKHYLTENEVSTNPLEQFEIWFKQAVDAGISEPNAMCLSTCGLDMQPKNRIVLLKDLDNGFVFYSNYKSQKGNDLGENPKAALNFLWLPIERQVRIEGTVEKVSEQTAKEYFDSRPLNSRLGAIVSPQSEVIETRELLEENLQSLKKDFTEENPPTKPQHWGGYRLIPNSIEFWQGRTSRLHDRLRYTLMEGEIWKMERLAP